MRVLDVGEGLQAPAVCFLCEQVPADPSVKMIDTGMHFAQEKYVHLAGRKYVCESCLSGLLDALMQYVLTHPEEGDRDE